MILYNVTGHFEPGKITVIVGPSGSGKTTLLKIISGKQQVDITGTITVNGAKQNRKMFRKQVCYVPQQFDLLPYLTTRETLYIAARLKLDDNQNKQAICSMVNDIAKRFNLSKCLDTLANKLSGGERKRLSIGVEMFIQPSVFLLDEPTSGLDSTDSNQLINILHDMARANCTVICTIHQPSSQMISLFDNIIVLNQGRCMYCGPKNEILNTYSIAGFTCPNFYNIIEFVLEVVTEQRGGDVKNLYKICCDEYVKFKLRNKHNEKELDLSINFEQKCGTKDTDTSINSITQKKSTWQQQKILFLRALIYIKRDRILTKLRFATHIMVALLLGTVFYNFVPIEATVFLQEHLNNWYSLRSYYSVKIISDLLMQIFCASSFMLISYCITGQPMEYDRILRMWGISLLITMLGQTVGVFSGIIFGTELGIFLIPAIGIPLLLFAGFFSKLGEMSIYLQPLGYVSFFSFKRKFYCRYAFEGVMQAIYLDRPNLTCLEIYCYLRSPNKILSMIGMPTVPFYVTVIILAFYWKHYVSENRSIYNGSRESVSFCKFFRPCFCFLCIISDNNLCKILLCKICSLANCTVICAIHQPSSQIISLFDDIMVLSQGRSMYCGPKSEILKTYNIAGFTCPNFYNIAEFVLEVITEQRGGDLENLYKICHDECEKFKLHSIQNKNKLIMEVLTKIRFVTHIGVALLLGTVFYNFGDDAEKVNSNIACLFFYLLFLFFVNAERTIQTFPIEAAVFLKEHLNNWYSLRSYYSVKIITDFVMQILCTSAFVFISYYMTGQPMEYDRILKTWIICLLITMLGQTVGIIAGTAFGTELGMFLLSATHIPLLLFAGFFTKIGEMSPYLQFLSVISYFRYAFEGIIQAVYVDRPNLKCLEIYCHLRSPSKILSMADMPTVPFYAVPIILSSWILCLHAVHYAILHWKIYYAKK
ncbi:ATP-binding cassette sub-family G member 1 [Trachymyrmex septentrionalis]|uniref:ATP-binding cassette sub-family G member 1 n=1 Tax=Trachymyrmex septentrionalis TaxID=34720 RepID=A0A151JVG0_9HYME|nr:ATP-binding cassette sub-family G member 1 [Trachymyrmex septentrionalis]